VTIEAKTSRPREFVTVVSGLPRSGTSMMMRALEAGGIPPMTDGERVPDPDNPRGYFELERVKAMRRGDHAWIAEARGKAVKVVSALLEWLPPSEAYRVLFMERALQQVLASQRAMLLRRAEGEGPADSEMAAHYEEHLAGARRWLDGQGNVRWIAVRYEEFVGAPGPAVERIDLFLGGGLDRDAMARAAEPALQRNRES
jgi:hypothetical protein